MFNVMEESHGCPICMENFRDESFLDECFHSFCFSCVYQWCEVQKKKKALNSNESNLFTCPLCKSFFSSIIHNCSDGVYFDRLYVIDSPCCNVFKPTLTQIKRRALYIQNQNFALRSPDAKSHNFETQITNLFSKNPNFFFKRRAFSEPEIQKFRNFINRELQALMQENNVDIVTLLLMGILSNFLQKCGLLVASKTLRPVQNLEAEAKIFLYEISAAVEPFIFEHAENFATELFAFLNSGLDIPAYDRTGFKTLGKHTSHSVPGSDNICVDGLVVVPPNVISEPDLVSGDSLDCKLSDLHEPDFGLV